MSGKSYFDADVPEVVVKSLFRKYDTDDSKRLGKEEMLSLLKDDLGFENDRAQTCILMVDKDGCGEISFDEFISWLRTEKGFGNIDNNSRYSIIEKAVELFKQYDKDGNDTIDKGEFKNLMISLNVTDDKQIDDALEALDTGGDGKISFMEFLAWLNWLPAN
ncbi:calmodulin-like protein 3 [Montipora capricornis]|uniref:calmodulin-like protein 3 n=1 Tax=Montipora foliosa TaxID=591990 RepID=UPI0035F1897A